MEIKIDGQYHHVPRKLWKDFKEAEKGVRSLREEGLNTGEIDTRTQYHFSIVPEVTGSHFSARTVKREGSYPKRRTQVGLNLGSVTSKKTRTWIVKHESGHMLEEPKTGSSSWDYDYLEENPQYITRWLDKEISATVRGYGKASSIPSSMLISWVKNMSRQLELPLEDSWSLMRDAARKHGIPYSTLKKVESKLRLNQ